MLHLLLVVAQLADSLPTVSLDQAIERAARLDPAYVSALGQVCAQLIASLDLHVIGEGKWHQFPPPGGVTGLFLLTESHLALHTYPEHGTATFNLYCCRTRREWDWDLYIKQALGARTITITKIERGDEMMRSAGGDA